MSWSRSDVGRGPVQPSSSDTEFCAATVTISAVQVGVERIIAWTSLNGGPNSRSHRRLSITTVRVEQLSTQPWDVPTDVGV